MQIKNNKIFTYPVLSEMNDDYIDSNFKVSVNAKEKNRIIALEIITNITNNDLLNLINQGKASIVCHLECAKTKFRITNVLSLGNNNIELDKTILNGNLEILTTVVANSPIKNYHSNCFNKEYGNATFNFEIGSILAIANQITIAIDKDIFDLSKVPSIISIVKNPNDIKKMQIDMTSDKIRVLLSKEDYNVYIHICKSELFVPIMHSTIIIPTLIYVFEELKREENNYIEYQQYRWYKALSKAFDKQYGKSLEFKNLNTMDTLDLAQEILNTPISLTFCNLSKLGGDE